jgi:hypothetical protein
MRLPSLLTLICSALTLYSAILTATETTEVSAGLAPFTVYMQGSIRTHYNADSSIRGLTYYDNNGTKYASQDWSYDAYGTVAKKHLVETHGWFNSRDSSFTYQYSVTDRVLQETQVYGWSSRDLKYSYNAFGQLEAIRAYDTSCIFPRKTESVKSYYNMNGNLSSRVFFNASSKKVLTQTWTYDYMGRLSEFKTLDGNDNLIWGSRTDYDVSYSCDVETSFDPYNQATSYIYTYYNDEGLVIERDLRDVFAQAITITMINYNSLNQVTRVADYDRNNNLIGFIQSYYDTLARAYQQDFWYQDKGVLRDRIGVYLNLPGNDLAK